MVLTDAAVEAGSRSTLVILVLTVWTKEPGETGAVVGVEEVLKGVGQREREGVGHGEGEGEGERDGDGKGEGEGEREGYIKRSILELPYAGDPSKSAYEPGFCVR